MDEMKRRMESWTKEHEKTTCLTSRRMNAASRRRPHCLLIVFVGCERGRSRTLVRLLKHRHWDDRAERD